MSAEQAPVELSARDARRIAVRAQLLDAPQRVDLLEVVRHLTVVQNDPARPVAPSAEIVAWSRLGSAYELGDLERLTTTGVVIELHNMLRPAEDIGLFRAEMGAWPGRGPLKPWQEDVRDWVEANDECRRDILESLRGDGPLPASQLPDTTVVPWQSSGWNNDRNVRRLLDMMVARGEIAAAGTEGRERVWDLAERIYPDGPVVPFDEAARTLGERRLRALGVSRAKGQQIPNETNDVGQVGVPAVIEGVRGKWRLDPAYLDLVGADGGFTGRTVLLSPIDRLVIDRKRMTEIFDFDYQLEMFKPAAKRRWGYWAMPILYDDRLVGKLDATADREAGVLRVDAVHEDGSWTPGMRADVQEQIDTLAAFLGLARV
ncbi:DNA glycosylase AlkZ-like family protein [Nocardioides sp. Soil796]|uniref:DNA glycosylase AlkZ-like family protein n=1 Tax=Nocardioides sp. Soil796 TaxID=1736412 RepID=UPI00070BC67D|nr:crosslink repair DNA glycosylase YcaQ family protein [Nocardioides sp. Soil796]KRF11914.1 hypothetical protein ASH02_18315 [Nocardioides sp. Soil796]